VHRASSLLELRIFHPACRGKKKDQHICHQLLLLLFIIYSFDFFFLVQKLCFAVAETPEREIPLNCNFLSLKAICLLVKFII
jgi:hypothetical protein